MINEKKSDYENQIKAFLSKGGKVQKGDKPNKQKIDKVSKAFLKKLGVMKSKEAELDAKDKAELEKMMDEELENDKNEAINMNRYYNALSIENNLNIWAEAAKKGEDPEPVKGKKTFTGKSQETIKINPMEKGTR